MRLYTPEEAAEQLGHITQHEIRGMCRRGEIAHVKGSRNKLLLTAEQIAAIVDHLTQAPREPLPPADPVPEELGFRTTSRSRAHSHKAS